ncbi:MAG: GTP-binding protein [Bacteroidales bacterium]
MRDDRAIVSDIPGTTRDAIEDTTIIDGVLFRFIDTAGIRETADIIENLGIRKTYQKISEAMVVLLVTEATDEPEIIIESVKAIRKQIGDERKKLVVVVNKSDLATMAQAEEADKNSVRAKRKSVSGYLPVTRMTLKGLSSFC